MKQEFIAKSEFEVCVIVIPTNFGQPFGQKLLVNAPQGQAFKIIQFKPNSFDSSQYFN